MGPHSIGVVEGVDSSMIFGALDRCFYDKEVAEAYCKYKQEHRVDEDTRYRVIEEEVI